MVCAWELSQGQWPISFCWHMPGSCFTPQATCTLPKIACLILHSSPSHAPVCSSPCSNMCTRTRHAAGWRQGQKWQSDRPWWAIVWGGLCGKGFRGKHSSIRTAQCLQDRRKGTRVGRGVLTLLIPEWFSWGSNKDLEKG